MRSMSSTSLLGTSALLFAGDKRAACFFFGLQFPLRSETETTQRDNHKGYPRDKVVKYTRDSKRTSATASTQRKPPPPPTQTATSAPHSETPPTYPALPASKARRRRCWQQGGDGSEYHPPHKKAMNSRGIGEAKQQPEQVTWKKQGRSEQQGRRWAQGRHKAQHRVST